MAKTSAVLGLDDLKKKLQLLEKATAGEALKAALRVGGVILQDEARRRVGTHSGDTAASIKIIVRRRADKATVEVGTDYFVGKLLEIGARPHTIQPKKGKALKLEGGGFARSVQHPGMPARPWLRPAFDSKREEIVEAVAAAMREEIRKALT